MKIISQEIQAIQDIINEGFESALTLEECIWIREELKREYENDKCIRIDNE